ncbi:MAG TPA: hypothetical protein VGO11_07175 [Chthoniobacteraceae bacterium]|jgi:hypothetical protein|nr:hypothetical protein [Chthoniobacteraceae bacterium]
MTQTSTSGSVRGFFLLLIAAALIAAGVAYFRSHPGAWPKHDESATIDPRLQRLAVLCDVPETAPREDLIAFAARFFDEMNPDSPAAERSETIFKAIAENENTSRFLNGLPSLAAEHGRPTSAEYEQALVDIASVKELASLKTFKAEWFRAVPAGGPAFTRLAPLIHSWRKALSTYGRNDFIAEKMKDHPADQRSLKILEEPAAGPSSGFPFVTLKDCRRWGAIDELLTGPDSYIVKKVIGGAVSAKWAESWTARLALLGELSESDPGSATSDLFRQLANAANKNP